MIERPRQTIAIIGGAVGEAAIGEELPPTNTNGDASASWALLVAALAAVAGLALVAADRKRLQA
jgi:ABC-type phosphate/phosphonate transport system permease subunit